MLYTLLCAALVLLSEPPERYIALVLGGVMAGYLLLEVLPVSEKAKKNSEILLECAILLVIGMECYLGSKGTAGLLLWGVLGVICCAGIVCRLKEKKQAAEMLRSALYIGAILALGLVFF